MLNSSLIYVKTFLFVFLILFTASCSDSKPDLLVTSFSNDLNQTNSIPTERTLQISVFANYSNGSKVDITKTLTWSSSDENLATVDAGLVSAKTDAGLVHISYVTQEKLNDGTAVHKNSVALDIKELILKEIVLSKSSLNMSMGTSQNITATATFDDNSTLNITDDCNWSSSNSTICSVDKGMLTALIEGNATIIATDSNVTSNSLEVEVTKVTYTDLSIEATKTNFNVEQTIELKAIVTTAKGEKIILDDSDVTWMSGTTSVVSIDDTTGIATAIAKDSAQITATLKSDTAFKDTITLSVIKSKYLRLFKENGEEIEFDTPQTHIFNKDSDAILAEFTIKAVGDTFSISELDVTNFNGLSIRGNNVDFIDLDNGDEISVVDGNRTFKLSHRNFHNNITYTFKINDETRSLFKQNYTTED